MKKYSKYYTWINSETKLDLLKEMIKLFDAEIISIEYEERDDEEWGMYECGHHVYINIDYYAINSEVLIKGFDLTKDEEA